MPLSSRIIQFLIAPLMGIYIGIVIMGALMMGAIVGEEISV